MSTTPLPASPSPKSVMRTCPSLSSSTFSGFRSLQRAKNTWEFKQSSHRDADPAAAMWDCQRRIYLRCETAVLRSACQIPAYRPACAQPPPTCAFTLPTCAPVHKAQGVQVRDGQHDFGGVQPGKRLIKSALQAVQVGSNRNRCFTAGSHANMVAVLLQCQRQQQPIAPLAEGAAGPTWR